MRQALALTFILTACGCVSNQQACETQYSKPEDVALCVLIKEHQDRKQWEPGGHLHHGMGGCVPNPMGGCLP